MDRSIRALHLIQRYHPFRGGSELVFGELSARLAADGHEVTVYTTDAWDLEYFWSPRHRRLDAPNAVVAGVPVTRWPVRHVPLGRLVYPVTRRLMTHLSDLPVPGRLALLDRLGRFSPWTPALAARVRQDAAARRFDLVHACNVTFESLILAARDYARRAGAPLVVTPFVHLGEPGAGRVRKYYSMAHQMRLVREADAVIAMTPSERDFLVARGVASERVSIVGAGVDAASVQGGDGERFRARLGLGRRPIVFSVGANAYDKGTVHTVDAMRRFWESGHDAALVLAGPRLSHFDAYLTRLPSAREHLHVLGPISDDERRDLYAAGDIFVLPSRTDSFGIVYLEAWACGKPVIGARAGGVPDVIRHGVDGLLVPFGDTGALAEAIASLLDDPERARAMGAAGRDTLPARSWEAVYRRIRAIYDGLVQSSDRRATGSDDRAGA